MFVNKNLMLNMKFLIIVVIYRGNRSWQLL